MKRMTGSMFRSARIVALTAGLLAAGLATAQNTWTGGGDGTNWFDGANWSGGVPGAAAVVSIDTGNIYLTNATAELASFTMTGGKLTFRGWATALIAAEMSIGGELTHLSTLATAVDPVSGEWVPEHRIWLKGSNITVIATTGKLNADKMGYRKYAGPGRATTVYGGGGHGAQGGRGSSSGHAGGPAYGAPDEPWQPGSGGGTYANSREGGGAIRVEATGQLDIRGTLTANGANGGYPNGPGGSGGSIWLTCRTLAGQATGLVCANGGASAAIGGIGGGGAGGRIALDYNTTLQAGLPEADQRPPIRFQTTPGAPIGNDITPYMGTLYLPDTLLISGTLDGQRFWNTSLIIPGFTSWAPPSLTMNNCAIGLPAGFMLDVNGNMMLTNGAQLSLPALPVADPLTQTGAALRVRGDLTIAASSWLLPYADATNGATVVITIDGDLVVAAGGGINADYKGYIRGYGPGTLGGINVRTGGGGYGGAGSQGAESFGGKTYGSPENPIQPGSGANVNALSGRGGGAIRLLVGDSVTLNGLLTACGAGGLYNGGDGGSGGGISLHCQTVQGSGSLIAGGGKGANDNGRMGGGGRIAVHYHAAAQAALDPPVPALKFSTYAHPSLVPSVAQMGTLYLTDRLFLTETLDQQRFWHVRLVVPDFDAWAPASLMISNCVVTLPEGCDFQIAGDLDLQPNAELHLYAGVTNPLMPPFGARLVVGEDLRVRSNAWIRTFAHTNNGATVALRIGRHATIDVGGGISADGGGYTPQGDNKNGPGAGQNNASSGGYGGAGGGTAGGQAYGQAALPLGPGSPGGLRGVVTGRGGGAIYLVADGTVTLNGTLTANGQDGIYDLGPGGSGGSIFVSGRGLTGGGDMCAQGGIGYGTSAGGGGGRIAVWQEITAAETAARIAAGDVTGLSTSAPPVAFTGFLHVDPGDDTVTGTGGTAAFYTPPTRGTILMIR